MSPSENTPECVKKVADVHGRLCEAELSGLDTPQLDIIRKELTAELVRAAQELHSTQYLAVWSMLDAARAALSLGPLDLPIRPHSDN